MKKVLVTGANGQLGRCIKDAAKYFPDLEMVFVTRQGLDITDSDSVALNFNKNNYDYCINTAAYTNVEKAESEPDKSFLVNAEAVKNIALTCITHNVVLIHISTDYVFDGAKQTPYTEEDKTNPINVYGASKLKGEQYIQEILNDYFIFRTSWLYSQYGHNFYNSILKFTKQGKELSITTEQIGTPTNANDLAKAILNTIAINSNKYGIYNFSNTGEATWFDFAKVILQQIKQFDPTKLAKTDQYRTFAARPNFSVLNTEKYTNSFNDLILDWEESLKSIVLE